MTDTEDDMSDKTYNELVTSGAPKLPDGYSYEVDFPSARGWEEEHRRATARPDGWSAWGMERVPGGYQTNDQREADFWVRVRIVQGAGRWRDYSSSWFQGWAMANQTREEMDDGVIVDPIVLIARRCKQVHREFMVDRRQAEIRRTLGGRH